MTLYQLCATPGTPTWSLCADAPMNSGLDASAATAALLLPAWPSCNSLPRLPSAGVKRSHGSAFEPFPRDGPEHEPACRTQRQRSLSPAEAITATGADNAAATASGTSSLSSASAIQRALSAGGDSADSGAATAAAAAAAAPPQQPHEELLRLAFKLLPSLPAPAAALLLAQLRAAILRGRAAALAARQGPSECVVASVPGPVTFDVIARCAGGVRCWDSESGILGRERSRRLWDTRQRPRSVAVLPACLPSLQWSLCSASCLPPICRRALSPNSTSFPRPPSAPAGPPSVPSGAA